jgi:hypothetical protein
LLKGSGMSAQAIAALIIGGVIGYFLHKLTHR